MATTTGLVQRVKLDYDGTTTWVYIGPIATNTKLLYVPFNQPDIGSFVNQEREAAMLSLMVDQLVTSMLAQREVTVHHAENDSRILSLEMAITGGLMPT